MARNTDFIGFTFNGRHSSEFGIYSVSNGSRYQDTLIPDPIDYTEQVPGGVGQYYFGSDIDKKEFSLNIAYDKLTEKKLRELRLWLAPDAIGELIFDERPYKAYTAKISGSPNISFICFDEFDRVKKEKSRAYKGEGEIKFICYYPLGITSGEKKELKWYKKQVDDRIYRSIDENFPVISYKLKDKEIAVLEKIKGKTIETGAGDKGPNNPYMIEGIAPTTAIVCGKNLWQGNRSYTVSKNSYYNFYSDAQTIKWVNDLPRGVPITFSANWDYNNGIKDIWFGATSSQNQLQVRNNHTVTIPKDATYDGIRVYAGDNKTQNAIVSNIQFEIGSVASAFESYEGQVVSLPEIEPMYGDDDVYDEYDAIAGIENRRWKRIILDGTEAWTTRTSGTGVYGYSLPDVFDAPEAAGICTHFNFIKNGASSTQTSICVASAKTQKVLSVFTTIATLDDFKSYLYTQYEAGTPVTIIYQLAKSVVSQTKETSPLLTFSVDNSNFIINNNQKYFNYFTNPEANISLRIYNAKYPNIDEWAISSGLLENLDTTGVDKGYDHYITLLDGSKGIQLYNPGDLETDFILSFNKPKDMNDIYFTLSDDQKFMLNLRSNDTDIKKYGAVSKEEKQIASMEGGVIIIDTKKKRIIYRYGEGDNIIETSIYFALKEGQFFKIPTNKTAEGGYNLVIGTTSNLETESIKIDYDYLYY